jgi:hypothetical protein
MYLIFLLLFFFVASTPVVAAIEPEVAEIEPEVTGFPPGMVLHETFLNITGDLKLSFGPFCQQTK